MTPLMLTLSIRLSSQTTLSNLLIWHRINHRTASSHAIRELHRQCHLQTITMRNAGWITVMRRPANDDRYVQ